MDNIFEDRLTYKATNVQVWILGIGLLLPSIYLQLHGQYSVLLFAIVCGVLITLWNLNKAVAVSMTFVFLLTLGDLRRIVGIFAGVPSLDPLLLVGAAVAVYVAVPVLLRLKVNEVLSKAVLGLTVLMVLEVFNPRQGSFLVGLSGALFCLVPLLWFWIGRRYATERMVFLLFYRVFVPMGVLAALLGIYQTYVGFLPWEETWIKAVGSSYSALNLGGGHVRSFGFSVNSVEYGNLLVIASVGIIAAVLAGNQVYALLLPVMFYAMILASMRGGLLKLLLASATMWALSGKGSKAWLPRLVLAFIVGLGCMVYMFGSRGDDSGAGAPLGKKASSAQYATRHVTQGLSHPFDSRYSTAGNHWELFEGGIASGFSYPIGSGLGFVTLGAGKFGGQPSGSGSSEVDISDQFITLGAVGGFLYLFIIGLTFKRAVTYVKRSPRALGLPLIGLFLSLLGGWIALGQYAVAPMVWIFIGFLARETAPLSDSTKMIFERLDPGELQRVNQAGAR
jgi:hypothetical protein